MKAQLPEKWFQVSFLQAALKPPCLLGRYFSTYAKTVEATFARLASIPPMPNKTALRTVQFVLLLIVAAVLVFGRKSPQPGPAPASIPGEVPATADSPIVMRRGPVRNPVSRRALLDVPSKTATLPRAISKSGDAQRIPADLQVRRHRIVEGDTIQDLARKYLGDPNRYEELVAINRAVLPHPNVLPLGEYLIIPPAAAASTPPTMSPTPPAVPSIPPYVNESPRPLLPVQ